jgi:rSAM/selenodomain-associated transferase 2
MRMQISTIIPTLNEADHIEMLIGRLRDGGAGALAEIIVADAGSTDSTAALAEKCGARVVHYDARSRPEQMNLAAKIAIGDVLYFVHADTLPPENYAELILRGIDKGADFGCFRFRFDSDRPELRFNSRATRLPLMICRGGDQSLFVSRQLFDRLGGFDESHIVMEDYDIIRRGKKHGRFVILPADVTVSARKYVDNSYTKVNLANFAVFSLYYLGVKPEKLKALYKRMIHHPKFEEADEERKVDVGEVR